MNYAKLLLVFEITMPVFACLGAGKWLAKKNILNSEHRVFLNWMVYHICLPFLVFNAVARQSPQALWNVPLILSALAPIPIAVMVHVLLTHLFKLSRKMAAAFTFCAFWANVTYLGFPLSKNAFGDDGLDRAAVFNAFAMTAYVLIGLMIVSLCKQEHKNNMLYSIRAAVLSPVVMAAIFGVLASLFTLFVRDENGNIQCGFGLITIANILMKTLEMLGSMGLPMALLVIGASLSWHGVKSRIVLLCVTVVTKLILMPILALLMFHLFFADVENVTFGVTVLLSGMPLAVAAYVISKQHDIESDFVAQVLVVTTVASMITIPVWLYFLLY